LVPVSGFFDNGNESLDFLRGRNFLTSWTTVSG
jgi:hypothetical protein